jgi:hypothetical protein
MPSFTRNTLLLCGALALSSIGHSAAANTAEYNIAAGATFSVASSPLAGKSGCRIKTGSHPYASQKFTVSAGDTYTLETTASTGLSNDTYLAFYSPSFDPANPTANLVSCDDDGGGSYLSKISATLTAGQTYELVITSYYTDKTGTVTASYTPNITLTGGTTLWRGGCRPERHGGFRPAGQL